MKAVQLCGGKQVRDLVKPILAWEQRRPAASEPPRTLHTASRYEETLASRLPARPQLAARVKKASKVFLDTS